MTDTPDDLTREFPMKAERIHLLKLSDPRFLRLLDLYQAVNRLIYRAETLAAPVERLVETTLRTERTALKDEIHAMLA